MADFLLDKDFLKQLDHYPRREVFARITSLTFDEQPTETIEGRITSGSVNIDGKSIVRRTCSLSMVTEQFNINDYLWGIKTKFCLEVGLKNEIDARYPDICWFPMGIYVINSFTSSITVNSRTISIQGKDKMCLLNGDLGGALPSIIDFGREEWYDYEYEKILEMNQEVYNDNVLYTLETDSETNLKEYKLVDKQEHSYDPNDKTVYYKRTLSYSKIVLSASSYKSGVYYIQEEDETTGLITYKICNDENFDENKTYYEAEDTQTYHRKALLIKKIIKEGVHAWGREPYHNIIINDLDTYGLEQLTYRDTSATDDDEDTEEKPLYIIKNLNNDTFQVTLNGDMNVWVKGDHENDSEHRTFKYLKDLSIDEGFIFDTGIIDATKVRLSNSGDYNRTVLRVDNAEDAGYRITDLTYVPEDGLTSNVGEAFTSILDKIKNMLDDFEYFYNLDGQFVFQRKKTYVNVNFSSVHNIDLENLYVDSAATAEKVTYDFTNNELISAININPALNNVKNDYAIQGKRTTASGAEVPIHLRYAIDKKPVYYKAIDGTIYVSKEYYDKEYNDLIKVVRQFLLDPNHGGEERDINELRKTYWRYVIDNMPRSSKDPNDLFFWSKHRSSNDSPYESNTWFNDKWIGIYFNGKTKLTYTVDPESYDISYSAGWWDLDAWADFYTLITGEPPTQSLAVYSGYKQPSKLKQSQRFSSISTSGDNDQYVEYVKDKKFSLLKDKRDNSQRIFFIMDAFDYIDTIENGQGTERAGVLANIQRQDKCQIYQTKPINNSISYFTYTKDRLTVLSNNYQKNRYYIKNNNDEYILCTEDYFDENKEYYERIYVDISNTNNFKTEILPDQYYTVSDINTFGTAAASNLTCVEAVSEFIDTGITATIEYKRALYEDWHDNWQPSTYYYQNEEGVWVLDDGEVWSDQTYYIKLTTPETHTFIFPCWIYNPQFPEGSFRQAFEKGFQNWLKNQGYVFSFEKGIQIVDWREIIYQMSKDYLKYAMSDTIVKTEEFRQIDSTWWPYGTVTASGDPLEYTYDPELKNVPLDQRLTWRDVFTTAIMKNNPDYYPTGVTGYEQYYTDLNAFWRELYNPNYLAEAMQRIWVEEENPQTHEKEKKEKWVSDFFISNQDLQILIDINEWEGLTPESDVFSLLKRSDDLSGWNYKLYFEPTSLNFWFDFLDSGEVAANYSVKTIGLRTYGTTNDKVSAVYFTKLPTICFYTTEDSENWMQKTKDQVMKESGYTFALLPKELENNFTISSRSLSAKDLLDTLLYQYSYVPEQLSITALPIYYLEPNTRIYVHDDETAIDGEYIVDKITLPLTHNGTMSISANKAPERII